MDKVKIIADSTCDLNSEDIKRLDISIQPLYITLNEETYHDGVDITVEEIFQFVDANRGMPKTSAVSYQDFLETFSLYGADGKEVIYIGISSELSATIANARLAAAEVGDNIHVVDSLSLSTGIGHSVMAAAQMAQEGANSQEILAQLEEMIPKVRASFLINTLEYLRKGGRCSALAMYGANLLNMKVEILVENGKMHPGEKYRGKFNRALDKYVNDQLKHLHKIHPKRIFVTHTIGTDQSVIDSVVKKIAGYHYFEEITETIAGSVIGCHSGPSTLGILFVMK